MANRFLVGSGNRNLSDPLSWSTFSGGQGGDLLGPELIVNGSFDTDTSWSKSGEVIISAGTASLSGISSAAVLYRAFSYDQRKSYKISFDVLSITGVLEVSPTTGDIFTAQYFTTPGSKSFVVTATVSKLGTFRLISRYVADSAIVDNVSVKEILTLPTLSDNVIIDTNSGTGTLTVDASFSCADLTCTNTQTITMSSAVFSFSIYGSMTLNSKIIWAFTGTAYTYLKATSAVALTMNGCLPAFNRLYIDGVGGIWTNQDDMDCRSPIYHANGTWATNGKYITLGTLAYVTSPGTKTLNLGSSTFRLNYIDDANPLNFTFIRGTSTVIFRYTNGGIVSSISYYNLILDPVNETSANLNVAINFTVLNILTIKALEARVLIKSSVIGTQRTITCGSLVASNVDLRDISIVQLPGGLDANKTDNLIIDLDKSAWAGSGKTLYLKGANAAPTSASLSARTSLTNKGVTISTN